MQGLHAKPANPEPLEVGPQIAGGGMSFTICLSLCEISIPLCLLFSQRGI
jgi:hypothetical protein